MATILGIRILSKQVTTGASTKVRSIARASGKITVFAR